MFSFRKIVSSLVLVSYIKMLVITSFAVDSAALSPQVHYKLKVDRQLTPQGALKHLELILQEKDVTTGVKKILRRDRITSGDEVPAEDIDWTTENKQDTGYKWHSLERFGAVRIDFAGNIFLENISQLEPNALFKVKGTHLITLRNCHFSHLQTQGMSTIFLGSNTIENLEAKATVKQGGVYCYARKSEPQGAVSIKNMRLRGDNFVNHSRLVIAGEGMWDLGGGDYINSGILTSQGALDQIKNVRLFSNANQITGEGLTVEAHSYVNETKGRVNLKTHTVKSAGLMMNEGEIHTTGSGDYQWEGEAFNRGQITSEQTYTFGKNSHSNTQVLYNYGLMKAQTGTFGALKVINHGESRQEQSAYRQTHLTNYKTMEMGNIPAASKSTFLHLNNSGEMKGRGSFMVMGGRNAGKLELNSASVTLGADSVFENAGSLWLTRLLGEGKFSNQGYCIPPLPMALV
jgi:filamentous hemagglutinin